MKSGTLWIVTLAVLSASLRLRNGSVSIGPCTSLLKGCALDVYSRMPPEQARDFERLKDALLQRYQLSADGFKKRFRSAKPEAGETPSQFLTRLDNYLERWIELAKVTKSYEGLKILIVQEQYLSTCPKEMEEAVDHH